MACRKLLVAGLVFSTVAVAFPHYSDASRKKGASAAPTVALTEEGQRLEAQYAEELRTLQSEISRVLPKLDPQRVTAVENAIAATKSAEAAADTANQASSTAGNLKAKIDNWKHFWIRGDDKKIAAAQAALNAATTDDARQAAQQQIAQLQANRAEGEKEIAQAQAELDRDKGDAAAMAGTNQAAQNALAQARANELADVKALLDEAGPFLSSQSMDDKLVKAAVLATATPAGLAEFAEKGTDQQALIDKLLADEKLMKEMLVAGGANFGKYGRAMEIYTAIESTDPNASQGTLHRLALATALEHSEPIKQDNAEEQSDAPTYVDPVKRYQDYSKAYLAGELDPAFKTLDTWEMRMVIDSDAPDSVLDWGRQMLRNYRPDHILNPNYGWRYSMTVRTDVRYGSQDGKNDLPSLNSYQNIIKDGGVCGRRAQFGRFILRAFGIPVWGVTQHKHAALSHWTPKGWVVNLGAGFEYSWWDKGDESLSGTDFLLETEARAHTQDYMKVLRAQWVSRILGEQAYNGRKNVQGGLWSNLAHFQSVVLAAQSTELHPLGEDLAEANEAQEPQSEQQPTLSNADLRVSVSPGGVITIPSAAFGKGSGSARPMPSFSGGAQILGSGGFNAQYSFEAPQAGKYALTAQVVTVQEGQKFMFAANGQGQTPVAVPYTMGMWKSTQPVEIELNQGRNTLSVAIAAGSRSVAMKDFTLTPVK